MKKRIISLLAIAFMLSTMLVINVNADMVLKDNYDAYLDSDDPTVKATFMPYDAATGIAFDSGTVKLYNDGNTAPIYDLRTQTSNQDFVLMFDMKQNQVWNVDGYLYRGDIRFATSSSLGCPTANEWYTQLFIVTKDAAGTPKAYYYRKLQSEPASSFALVSELSSTTATVSAGLRFNFGAATHNGKTLWIDNVEVHTGMYISEKTFLADGTTSVSSLSEVPAGTTSVTANINIYDGDLVGGDLTLSQNIVPVFISFDAKGKMLDCNMISSTIKAMDDADNAYTISCPYTSDVSRMQLLMWDSIDGMQSVFDPIELN